MKKQAVLTALLAPLAAALFLACDPDPKPVDGDIRHFFQTVAAPAEQATFLAENGISFVSQSGTAEVRIQPSSLLDAAGQVATGTVSMKFLEIRTKGDMILNNRTTQTVDGYPLESGGEVFLRLTQNGQELSVQPGRQPEIRLRFAGDGAGGGMDVFYGAVLADSTFFGWVSDGSDSTANVAIEEDSGGVYYSFYPDSLDWINCDRFMDVPDHLKTGVCAKLPDEFSVQNCVVYLVFNDRESVLSFWEYNAGSRNFCAPQDIPLGDDVTLVAIGWRDEGEIFLDHQTFTVEADKTVELKPEKTSLEDLKAFLETL